MKENRFMRETRRSSTLKIYINMRISMLTLRKDLHYYSIITLSHVLLLQCDTAVKEQGNQTQFKKGLIPALRRQKQRAQARPDTVY